MAGAVGVSAWATPVSAGMLLWVPELPALKGVPCLCIPLITRSSCKYRFRKICWGWNPTLRVEYWGVGDWRIPESVATMQYESHELGGLAFGIREPAEEVTIRGDLRLYKLDVLCEDREKPKYWYLQVQKRMFPFRRIILRKARMAKGPGEIKIVSRAELCLGWVIFAGCCSMAAGKLRSCSIL